MTALRRCCALLLPAALLALPCGAPAQDAAAAYPARPVTIISPYVPGSSTQQDGLVWADKLRESLGKPFLIDFKPGAGTTVGNNYVAKAAPDGYTLLIVTGAYTIVAATYRNLAYDPVRDLAPVSMNTRRPTLLVVSSAFPAKSLAEYMAHAKERPGAINFATTGVGGQYHLIGAWMHGLTNTRVTYVHYKGAGPAFADLAAGRVDVSIANFNFAFPFIKAGKIRPISILSTKNSALFPTLRPAAEQGLTDFEWSAWGGVLAPARTPPAIVNKLAGEFARIARMPDVIARFAGDETELVGSTPEYFGKVITTEIARWKKLVADHGIDATEE